MNHLIHEKSPYLQQHAHNPVEWYPWGGEAFDRARLEDKPIFLSIGYSTCHWCHVMERESFEDADTAELMNRLYINIKVDREERPDVDQVYMTAAQALTGSGGWPLSAWLTPDLKPFYVGTYFPPRAAYGRPSFTDALKQLHQTWTAQRGRVLESAQQIAGAIAQLSVITDHASGGTAPDYNGIADLCYAQLERSYDPQYGGFGGPPKFPRPAVFTFLLRYYKHTGQRKALDMTLHTLRKMADGGMYDQLGGGFARYSVDAQWRVPHFEKMLYDQGQLLAAYADACRITGHPAFARTIHHTAAYLSRDLQSPGGAFYCGEDADSQGEEGTFYVWTQQELKELLSPEQFCVVEQYYGITAAGNFEHGKNVLHISADPANVAETLGIAQDAVQNLLQSARDTLFRARTARPRPHRDEKILCAWNGLAISGLCAAAGAAGNPVYEAQARRAADNVLDAMQSPDGRLMRRLKDDEARFDGYLEDYAFFIQGLLDLYQITFHTPYLQHALRLTRAADELFSDTEGGGYFMTSGTDHSILVRSKSDHDSAEPSGNSVMALNLLRLGNLLDDQSMLTTAQRTIDLFMARVADHPAAMPLMAAAALQSITPPQQIVVAPGTDAAGTKRLLDQVQRAWLPGAAILLCPATAGADPWLLEHLPALGAMKPVNGAAAVYVCQNFVCHKPQTEFVPE